MSDILNVDAIPKRYDHMKQGYTAAPNYPESRTITSQINGRLSKSSSSDGSGVIQRQSGVASRKAKCAEPCRGAFNCIVESNPKGKYVWNDCSAWIILQHQEIVQVVIPSCHPEELFYTFQNLLSSVKLLSISYETTRA